VIAFIFVDLIKYGALCLLDETNFQELQCTEEEGEQVEVKEEEQEECKEAPPSRRPSADLEQGRLLSAAAQASLEDHMDKYIRLSSRLRSFDRWVDTKRSSYEQNVMQVIGEQNRRALSDSLEAMTEHKDKERKLVEARRTTSAPSALRQQFAPPHGDRLLNREPILFGKVTDAAHADQSRWLNLSRHSSSASLRPHTPAQLASQLTDRHRERFKGKM
jgi:hypothetical protein